jgi:hypothetical protein
MQNNMRLVLVSEHKLFQKAGLRLRDRTIKKTS